jgi:hypothetical protein
MAILLLADHDNATLSDQTAKALTAAQKIGGDVHVLVAGKGAKAAADAAAKLSGVSKVLLAESDDLANNLAEPLAADRFARRQLRHHPVGRHLDRQERSAARCSAAWTLPRFRKSPKSFRPTRSSGRSMPAMPSRRFSRLSPKR